MDQATGVEPDQHDQHDHHGHAQAAYYEQALLQDDGPLKDDKFKLAVQSLFVCECGKHIVNANEYNIARHKSSKRHAEALTNSDSEFFICECGKRLLRSQKENEDNMAQHRASRKHIQAMAKKQKLVHTDLGIPGRPDDTVWASTLQSLRSQVLSLELIKEAEDELMRGLSSLEQEYQRTSSLLTMMEKTQHKALQKAEKLQNDNMAIKASVAAVLQARDQVLNEFHPQCRL
ncbi:hypothetical protein, variant 3 [Aphanomyces invadans]|uniref:Uncharacterized protein n=1 Tax=Aphanomyces invadans TaxID=157072 RepID=A0A024TEW8_9STRA|nr:hypothetical protein, variant 2 [Aphanomyces invadans]XP_008878741.1 hypothetical protein, variant 3 [Aphanomyces invadans]ETV92704.1 hypothetical protein, variant 2 [Aphanomyces invadans]ETV92705.1 hypothetical protein, variant 3 [Aphanomyces invadans]|eukprot:XP_008878740.1 hypothetical protein, variant 2 [Aphanomyces invadans]